MTNFSAPYVYINCAHTNIGTGFESGLCVIGFVFQLGGIEYKVLLGRRDSLTANQSAANDFLPSPFDNYTTLLAHFVRVGLDAHDLVTLSGTSKFSLNVFFSPFHFIDTPGLFRLGRTCGFVHRFTCNNPGSFNFYLR
jgi:hypothetical protein